MQNKTHLQERLLNALRYLPAYFANPIRKLKYVTRKDWLDIILIQFIVSVASGIATGLVQKSILLLAWGIFIFPVVALSLSFVFALILQYSIILFFQVAVSLRRTFHLVVLANLPFLVIRIASPVVPSVDILGFLFGAFLLSIGLIESHKLPKQKVIKLMAALSILVVVTWLVHIILASYWLR